VLHTLQCGELIASPLSSSVVFDRHLENNELASLPGGLFGGLGRSRSLASVTSVLASRLHQICDFSLFVCSAESRGETLDRGRFDTFFRAPKTMPRYFAVRHCAHVYPREALNYNAASGTAAHVRRASDCESVLSLTLSANMPCSELLLGLVDRFLAGNSGLQCTSALPAHKIIDALTDVDAGSVCKDLWVTWETVDGCFK